MVSFSRIYCVHCSMSRLVSFCWWARMMIGTTLSFYHSPQKILLVRKCISNNKNSYNNGKIEPFWEVGNGKVGFDGSPWLRQRLFEIHHIKDQSTNPQKRDFVYFSFRKLNQNLILSKLNIRKSLSHGYFLESNLWKFSRENCCKMLNFPVIKVENEEICCQYLIL